MKKISVIIPVYNVEKYLERCLDSVIKQTLKEIEIIILNDGSTDSSFKIAEKYARKDDRIKIYAHENIGLGPTRNIGVNKATGEYLAFVDSDDFIEKDMLEILYNSAKKNNADIVCSEVIMYYSSDKKIKRNNLDNDIYSFDEQNNLEFFYKNYYFTKKFSHNACDKIYRRKLIEQENILFGDNKKIFAEDNYFQLQVIDRAKIISFEKEAVYYYYVRENSIMNSYKEKLLERNLFMIKELSIRSNDMIYRSVLDVLNFEILISEILNVLLAKKGVIYYYKQLKFLSKEKDFMERIDSLIKVKGYKFYNNKPKEIFASVVSRCLKNRMILFSTIIVYVYYNSRK